MPCWSSAFWTFQHGWGPIFSQTFEQRWSLMATIVTLGQEPVHVRAEAAPVLGQEPVGGAGIEHELRALDAGGKPALVGGRDQRVLEAAAHEGRGVDPLRVSPVREPLRRCPELSRQHVGWNVEREVRPAR